jgi:AraC-like DNA-binding protein
MSTQRSNQLSYAPEERDYNKTAPLYNSAMASGEPIFNVEFHATPLRPPLDAFVEVVWAVKGLTFYTKETVLPNGRLELMINFGSMQRALAFGGRAAAADHGRYWLAGLQNEPLTIESVAESNLISIRFRPGGAHAIFGAPIHEFNDQVIDLDLLLGNAVDGLRSHLAEVSTFDARVAIIEDWLLQRLAPREYEYRMVGRALVAIESASGHTRIGEMCEEIGLSNKHMISLFRKVVGASPKGIARIMRFHKLINHVSTSHNLDWADVALHFKYYDQSHLIREFRQFAGVTPLEYVARRTPDGTSLVVA